MGPAELRPRVTAMAADQRFSPSDQLDRLVAGALGGNDAAWGALVERLQRVVWKAVNMMTYDPEIRDDAFAATWLRLAERLDSIREPHKLPGWLTTTACNEVRQILRHRGREGMSLDAPWRQGAPAGGVGGLLDTLIDDSGEHADGMLADERRREVRSAFDRLDGNCREIITVLVLADPPVPYDEASERLERPIGSLGPSRRRCLDKLRTLLEPEPGGDV